MKKLTTMDLRENKNVKSEEGRVYLFEGSYGTVEFVGEAGPVYRKGNYTLGYVQVLNDRFISFDAEHTYEKWIVDEAIDYLVEKGVVEYSKETCAYYLK